MMLRRKHVNKTRLSKIYQKCSVTLERLNDNYKFRCTRNKTYYTNVTKKQNKNIGFVQNSDVILDNTVSKSNNNNKKELKRNLPPHLGISLREKIYLPKRYEDEIYFNNFQEIQKFKQITPNQSRVYRRSKNITKKKISKIVKTDQENHLNPVEATATLESDSECNRIYTIIDNKSVEIDWYAGPLMNKNDLTDNEKTTYVLKNIISHNMTLSCAYMTLSVNYESVKYTKDCIKMYKIEQGKALVKTQSHHKIVTSCQSFYIPLGVSYSIKNCSERELLVLFFTEMRSL
ncbi:hypothetical protein FQR65_LT04210 [Abscondita terminalis]|nr:hypothetical protein FQR65_LT04210 [Abscondita terminalis]